MTWLNKSTPQIQTQMRRIRKEIDSVHKLLQVFGKAVGTFPVHRMSRVFIDL